MYTVVIVIKWQFSYVYTKCFEISKASLSKYVPRNSHMGITWEIAGNSELGSYSGHTDLDLHCSNFPTWLIWLLNFKKHWKATLKSVYRSPFNRKRIWGSERWNCMTSELKRRSLKLAFTHFHRTSLLSVHCSQFLKTTAK